MMDHAAISAHLLAHPVPSVALPATDGAQVDLSRLTGTTVVYAFPRTSPPDAAPIEGWDQIPGAKGCTLQSREYSVQFDALLAAGADQVYGLSTQATAYQQEACARLHLPFPMLSDAQLRLADAMDLPRFEAGGMVLLTRITFIVTDGRVAKVFFPVANPGENAADVAAYLAQ